MSSLNKAIIMGRLTSDPELKKTTSGTSVSSFTVAINRIKDVTDFVDCVAWKDKAEFLSKYFRKGNMVCIVGEINTRTFEDNGGNKRKATEINVREIIFTGEKAQTANETETKGAEPIDEPNMVPVSNEDFLPF